MNKIDEGNECRLYLEKFIKKSLEIRGKDQKRPGAADPLKTGFQEIIKILLIYNVTY